MENMFYDCSSLKILNIQNFNIQRINYNMFTNCNPNLIYCINKINEDQIISLDIIDNCSLIEEYNSKYKLIMEKNEFIINCTKDNIYKYEYKNLCYESCPKRTKNSSEFLYLCEDLNCNNYYNFEQTECLDNITEGYYLNNSFLKTIDKCHNECKACDKKPTINNSNC